LMDLHFNIVLPLPFCSAKKKRLVSDPCGRSSPIKVGYVVAICVNSHSGDGPNCLGKAMARLPAGQRDIGTVSTDETMVEAAWRRLERPQRSGDRCLAGAAGVFHASASLSSSTLSASACSRSRHSINRSAAPYESAGGQGQETEDPQGEEQAVTRPERMSRFRLPRKELPDRFPPGEAIRNGVVRAVFCLSGFRRDVEEPDIAATLDPPPADVYRQTLKVLICPA
jgi:hypothetical protein